MSYEVRESGRSKGGAWSGAKSVRPTSNGRSPKDKAKPYCISRQEVLEAYRKVKSNKGAAGVDEQTIEDFERDLKNNLYRVWNRMSSGSYFPPPVRTVKIPKANGGERLRKEVSSALCWQTCFCITRSICGCAGSGSIFRSSVMPMTSSCIAERSGNPS